jgi:hypothetical protein
LQLKIERDNEELQRQYDEERGIKTSPPPKSSRKQRKKTINADEDADGVESKRIRELEEKLAQQRKIQQQKNDPKVEEMKKQMEKEREEAREEAKRAREEMKALMDEMKNLKTSVSRQPVEQPTSAVPVEASQNPTSLEMMRMKQMADMQAQLQLQQQQAMMLAQQQSPMNQSFNQSKSAAEIELEKMKEEKRANEMKQLRDEMMELRKVGAASPEVKMLKDEIAEMRRASIKEQNELREKLSTSLGGGGATVDLSGDPGLATVRRTNKELKSQYAALMSRVEEQSKLITELRQGITNGVSANMKAEEMGTTHKDIIKMKNELNAMKAEMAMRSMEMEQEKRRSKEVDDSIEEELRAMMEDSAGVFTSVAEMEASLPNTSRSEGPSTARIMSSNMYDFGPSGDNGDSLNLDAIISGAGGTMGGVDTVSPLRYDNASVRQPTNRSNGMKMAGESLSSASKFIFPDGQTAPAGTPRQPSQSSSSRGGDMVPPLQLAQLDLNGRQTDLDRLNVTSKMRFSFFFLRQW